jgi:hypothetical protein
MARERGFDAAKPRCTRLKIASLCMYENGDKPVGGCAARHYRHALVRDPRANGQYSLYQQGTYAPNDGVHRWMGSTAMDKKGNVGLGYSVVNETGVYPGIRYTGRLKSDPLGQMTLGEGTIVNGSGVQLTTNSRWGDYTSLKADPVDDCTLCYVNEYYTAAGSSVRACSSSKMFHSLRIQPGLSTAMV